MKTKNATTATHDHEPREIWKDALKGVLVAALIVVAKVGVENVGPFKWLDIYGYSFLQKSLAVLGDAPPPRVVVVDLDGLIDAYAPSDDPLAKRIIFTPRPPLLEVLRAVADCSPLAIGVDIDFSKSEDGWEPPGSLEFLEGSLELSKKTPVVLGVGRQWLGSQNEWLGAKRFADLAGCIEFPTSKRDSIKDYTLLPLSVITTQDEHEIELKGMGAKLGEHVPNAPPRPQNTWFAEVTVDLSDPKQGIVIEKFSINTGSLGRISDRTIRGFGRQTIADNGDLIKDSIVLLGDATLGESKDTFPLWGIWRDPVPGVLLHACAAQTRGERFLFRPTHLGRIVLDAGLAVGAVLVLALLRLWLGKRANPSSLEQVLPVFTFCIVLVVGSIIVKTHALLWTDFILVSLALLLHPTIEHYLLLLARSMRRGN